MNSNHSEQSLASTATTQTGVSERPLLTSKEEVPAQDEALPPEPKHWRFKVTIFMLCLITSTVALDSVIVSACLPAIAVSLKGESLEVFWVGTSFLLAQTVVIPLYGTFSDIFGRKWVIIFAACLFMVGSILCGCAQSMAWLIGARVAQGMGAGGILALASVIVSDMTTLRERPKFLSFMAFAWALGSNIGVPVGGAIGEFTSWRWIFWINIPICVISIAGLIFFLCLRQDTTSLRSKLSHIDYIGISIFVASMTSLMYGITTGGTTHPWSSMTVITLLVVGVIGLGIFVIVESEVSAPMVPLRLFSNRSTSASYFGAFIHGLVVWATVYYLIIFFLGARRDSLFKSSLETLPSSAPIAFSAFFAGMLIQKTLQFRKLTWIAWILLTAGLGLMAMMEPYSGTINLYVLRLINAVGAGFLFQVPVYAVQSHLQNKADMGMATSAITFFRCLGQAFGVAIGGNVFQNEFDRYVGQAVANGMLAPEFVVTGAQAAGAYAQIGTFPAFAVEVYTFVYADALRTVWYVITGLAGMGLLASLAIRDASMDKGHQSNQRFSTRLKEVVRVSLGARPSSRASPV